jgi:hypothetical protein
LPVCDSFQAFSAVVVSGSKEQKNNFKETIPMSKLTRRSIVSTILPATILGFVLPRRAKASDQDHMRDAQEALRKAKRELQDATAESIKRLMK